MFQEKKEYLSRYLLQETKINSLRQLEQLTPQEKLRYKSAVFACLEIRLQIEEKIKRVDDDLLSEVLRQKYVFGKTLEQIALTLNYSKRHIERLHIKALEKFEL